MLRMAGKATKGTHPTGLERPPGSHPAFQQPCQHSLRTASNVPTDEDEKAKLALEIDRAMREKAPAGWKGDDTREKQVLNALFPLDGSGPQGDTGGV